MAVLQTRLIQKQDRGLSRRPARDTKDDERIGWVRAFLKRAAPSVDQQGIDGKSDCRLQHRHVAGVTNEATVCRDGCLAGTVIVGGPFHLVGEGHAQDQRNEPCPPHTRPRRHYSQYTAGRRSAVDLRRIGIKTSKVRCLRSIVTQSGWKFP